tara:strand:+ start:368 stop:1696 length:1329 start_codon:yes stop_codon:yes gene_type:complete
MKFKIKLKKPNIKKILKAFGKGILNTFTMLTISIGSVLAFSSYINPVPFIAQQFPNLILGTYTFELLFNDVKWWQSLGYIAWSISSGLIVFGLAIHIRSIGRLWKGIKATPKAIINTPVNTYRKLRAGRDWLFHKIEYLNSESKKWKMAFNIAKVPYTILTKAGFSPQMAISLLAVGGTVGSGIVVNEVLADRTFEAGDAGYYSSNNPTGNINIPDETLEQALKRQDGDNTLRIVVKTLPIQEVSISNVSIGTAYNSSTLPTYATNTETALLVEGTNSSTLSIVTFLEVGELIFEKNRCKQLVVENVTAHTIEIIGNSSDGQSITQSAGTGIRRSIIGGHFQSKSLKTEYGLYDFVHLSADTNGVNGKIGKLVISNTVSKGGKCYLNRIKADTVRINFNRVGAGTGFGSKDFKIMDSVNAVHWVVEDNVELLTSEVASLPTE